MAGVFTRSVLLPRRREWRRKEGKREEEEEGWERERGRGGGVLQITQRRKQMCYVLELEI